MKNRKSKYFLPVLLWFSVAFFTSFCSTGLCAATGDRLSITNIFLDKKTFLPETDGVVEIRYSVSTGASVTVKFYDSRDVLVRTLIENERVEAGAHAAVWDGKNDAGVPLPPGPYVYTIEAVDDQGDKTVYDPADATGGLVLDVRKSYLDTKKGELSYVMPKAGMVRIRAGIKEGPLLRTLIDWTPKEAGRQVEKWEGKDKSGLIDLFEIPEREVIIFAYSLPDNSIILSAPPDDAAVKRTLVRDSADPPIYRTRKPSGTDEKSIHALHDKAICHEPSFQVLFPNHQERTTEGAPIVNGVVPVKIVISEDDRRRLESERFEVMFFVDAQFLFEDEEGFTPFTFMWDTRGLVEGEHVFTVNIWSYDDHCGVESRNVLIRR